MASCAVGIKHKGTVYIGVDSLATDIEANFSVEIKDDKVFMNDNFLISFCGNPRIGQILKPNIWIPETDDIYVLSESIREQVKERGAMIHTDRLAEEMEACLLVGHKKRLYSIGSNFQVTEANLPYYSIGNGGQYAFGALYNMRKNDKLSPEDRIVRALKAASFFCPSVGGEIKIMHM